jgi:hypothetical protein
MITLGKGRWKLLNKASSMNLFASSGVNSTMMVEADFVSAALDSHPMYLMSAFGMKGL